MEDTMGWKEIDVFRTDAALRIARNSRYIWHSSIFIEEY